MILVFFLIAFAILPSAPVLAMGPMGEPTGKGIELMMVEEDGCVWCARWKKEIGPIYPKTEEGKKAPLRTIDKHRGLPDGITTARGLFFTPTFVLLVDGVEAGRIEGYPGEDFFWGLLAQLVASVDKNILANSKDTPTAPGER